MHSLGSTVGYKSFFLCANLRVDKAGTGASLIQAFSKQARSGAIFHYLGFLYSQAISPRRVIIHNLSC